MSYNTGHGLRPVPRSKGCITCISRKTRCDGRRPTCQACERRKQVCRGYRRGEFIFMNEGWRAPGLASRTRDPKSSRLLSVAPSKPITQDPLHAYVAFFLSQFTPAPPPEARVMLDRIRRSLGRLLSFVQPPAPDVHGDPLAHAAEALVMTHFGKLNLVPQLVHDSAVPYVRALKSLSAKLADIQRSGIGCIEEEDVMQLMFACLFLTLWELAMDPQGTAWQKHARGLANIVQWRGPQGFQSPRNLQVITFIRTFILLESISSKQPTFLSQPEWQRFRNFRPQFPPWCPAPPVKTTARDGASGTVETGPMHYLDFTLDHLIIVANLTAEFADRMKKRNDAADEGSRPSLDDEPSLRRMQAEGLTVLERLETVLAHMMANIGGPFAMNESRDHASGTETGPFWGKPLEYNLASMCRTAAVTLRLLMCDVVKERKQQRWRMGCGDADSHDAELAQHRAALMAHVEAIVSLIPYSANGDIFGVAPVCFVPTFRAAGVVLEREAEALRAEGVDNVGGEVARCARMDRLIQNHLDFVASRKIPVKIDI
ncbi:hypothetical protein OQA88_9370 [Cercophora sp. LCS_1]